MVHPRIDQLEPKCLSQTWENASQWQISFYLGPNSVLSFCTPRECPRLHPHKCRLSGLLYGQNILLLLLLLLLFKFWYHISLVLKKTNSRYKKYLIIYSLFAFFFFFKEESIDHIIKKNRLNQPKVQEQIVVEHPPST